MFLIFVYQLDLFLFIGFLNLQIPECPGNVGLKDVVEGIKWVKKNIREFGGDPNNITLCGTSSGATSVHFLLLSPLTKGRNLTHFNYNQLSVNECFLNISNFFIGLFNKVIASSGDASSMWGLVNNPVECAINFGNCLGFKGTDKKELLTFFKSLSAKDLLDGIFKNKNLPCVVRL